LRGNTKASWSSTTGKAGRQARHFPKIHEAINQGLGFSELFPITDGLEDEIIRLPSSTTIQQQTNKQWVGVGVSDLSSIIDGLEDGIIIRLPFPTTIQQTNKKTVGGFRV
jgi:hypothetical protein